MRMIYCAVAQSVFSYGIYSWRGAYNTHLKKLTLMINLLLKMARKLPYRTNTNILYNTYNLFKLKQLHIHFMILILLYS